MAQAHSWPLPALRTLDSPAPQVIAQTWPPPPRLGPRVGVYQIRPLLFGGGICCIGFPAEG